MPGYSHADLWRRASAHGPTRSRTSLRRFGTSVAAPGLLTPPRSSPRISRRTAPPWRSFSFRLGLGDGELSPGGRPNMRFCRS